MPLYDFHCPECGLDFEVSRPRSEAANPVNCPQDGTEATRIFTPLAFVKPGGAESAAPPPPAPGLDGHGHGHSHSHGPGGHTH